VKNLLHHSCIVLNILSVFAASLCAISLLAFRNVVYCNVGLELKNDLR
jgi:hypothetical protein